MGQRGDMLLRCAIAIPLAYEGVRLLEVAASWFRGAAELDGDTSSLGMLIMGVGIPVVAAVLFLACGSLLSNWRPRWLWLLVAVLCAMLAVGEAYVGTAVARWEPSAHTAIQVYAVVLAVALLVSRRPAKLTSAST